MEDNIKQLTVLLTRLPETLVEKYYEKYERDKDKFELKIENEELIEECESINEKCIQSPVINTTYLQETGLNVSLIAKKDKKLVKLNVNGINKTSIDSSLKINNQENETTALTERMDVDNATDGVVNESITLSNVNEEDINDDLAKAINVATASTIDEPNTKQSKTMSLCYKCNKCGKLFTRKLHLKSHMMQQHDAASGNTGLAKKQSTTSSAKIICNECGKLFNTQTDFNRHLQIVHNAIKPYKCSLCSMAFYDVSSKNRHEKEHSGLKPFRCYICSFEFTRASNLRAHLIKLHSNEIGKSVIISKTPDNKLKFEFDIDAINLHKEQQRFNKFHRANDPSNTPQTPTNAIIYIKDPNNKSSDIQYMVVYVDGKPIFVQNPKGSNLPQQTQQQQDATKLPQNLLNTKSSRTTKIKSIEQQQPNQPIAKIPYLLAAAAAAAASNRCTMQSAKKEKNDHEYQQVVSMFKQKNEKLFNPLQSNPLQNTHANVTIVNSHNNSVC